MSDATTPDDTHPGRVRTRTITWDDPSPAAEASHRLSGLEFLRGIITGELPIPPMCITLDFRLTEAEEGRTVVVAQPGEYQYNPLGSVHGGLAATLLDAAMACAVQTTLPVGVGCTTLEIKINYVRPIITETGVLRCEGKIIHTGGRTATAEGRLMDQTGKLYAHGTTTCLIQRP